MHMRKKPEKVYRLQRAAAKKPTNAVAVRLRSHSGVNNVKNRVVGVEWLRVSKYPSHQ